MDSFSRTKHKSSLSVYSPKNTMNILPMNGPMSCFVHRVPEIYTEDPLSPMFGEKSYSSIYELSPSNTEDMFRERGIDVNYVFPPNYNNGLRSPLLLSPAYSPDPSDYLAPSPQITYTPLMEPTPYDSPISLPPVSPRRKSHKKSSSSLSPSDQKKPASRKNREATRKQKKQAKSKAAQQSKALLTPPPPALRSPAQFAVDDEEHALEDMFILDLKEGQCLTWKDIAAQFRRRFGKTMQIAALQMRYTRMRSRGWTWTTAEEDLLQRAADDVLKTFWRDVSEQMVKLGAMKRVPADMCRTKWQDLNANRVNEPCYLTGYETD